MTGILAHWWPIIFLTLGHLVYQISAKSVPSGMDPYAAVFINYIVAAAAAFILWMVLGEDKSMAVQLGRMNWAPVTMALSITLVEVCSVFMFKLGWEISIGSTIANILLAVALVFTGLFLYGEAITAEKVIGILLCVAGLYFVTK